MASPVCVVAGFGPGNGAAFTRRFASEGYRVAMLARSEAPLRDMEAAVPARRASSWT
jgi:NAD(P)-dependent dehydrogenase (short-subunit alcohol dehydrogenase family)